MSDPVVVTLSTPVEHAGDELLEISLREVTAGDLSKCGYPMLLGEGNMVVPIPANISALISRCGRVPPSVVAKLTAKDFNKCMAAVLGFLEDAEAI